ncbi:MAG TPA: ATP-binding protein [Ignavibacteria bacterium]|nr:ATP-binding protein [Ignavibacteria bacterium]
MDKFTKEIQYDNAAIIQQASHYIDPYRILAEYIDNSIDAAEIYYDKNSYSRNIEISVIKTHSTHDGFKIIIQDNCSGMEINSSEPFTIFRSVKRQDQKTNGMFGFGMFSFFAICNKIQVSTIRENSDTKYSFEITTDTFNKPDNEKPTFEISESSAPENSQSGTIFTLSDFNPDTIESINFEELRTEIEKHFELILNREGISLTLKDGKNSAVKCIPFEYSKYSSETYVKVISALEKTHSKKKKTIKEIDISDNPVKIFLIASADTEFNRYPFFVYKGRRVTEISKIEQFRTVKKFQIWSRSNITGYIDITGVLEPTPNRKEFKNTELSKAFFQTLLTYEDDIIKQFDSHSKFDTSETLKDLETKINHALKDFNYDSTSKSSTGEDRDEMRTYKYKGYKIRQRNSNQILTPGNKTQKTLVRNKKERLRNTIYEITLPGGKEDLHQNKNSLTLKIDSLNDPHKDISKKPLRSIIRENTVYIFAKHPEFQSRVGKTSKSSIVITDRLENYIAMEYITQYLGRINPEFRDSYMEFVKAVLSVEEKFKELL